MGAAPSHQTIRLSRGTHRDPGEGASVMELASMLAGEPFSDRPRCACPVIAAFLRAYGDAIGDARRQDLYRHAAQVVGTAHGSAALRARRADMCREWVQQDPAHRRWEPWRKRRQKRAARRPEPPSHEDLAEVAARVAAARLSRRDEIAHALALTFVDQLIAARDPGTRGPDELSRADQDWLSVRR